MFTGHHNHWEWQWVHLEKDKWLHVYRSTCLHLVVKETITEGRR